MDGALSCTPYAESSRRRAPPDQDFRHFPISGHATIVLRTWLISACARCLCRSGRVSSERESVSDLTVICCLASQQHSD